LTDHAKTSRYPYRQIVILLPLIAARRCTPLIAASAALFSLALSAQAAKADFRLCNNTGSRVGVALGYKNAEGWTTEGWWNVPSRTCESLLRGALVARYYYIYAVDYERGGEWSGHAYMCSREKEFTIRGTDNCLARGFDRTGFFEVDTREQRSWTVQLTDTAEQKPFRRSPSNSMHPAATAPPAPADNGGKP
jgi:uncharacterized membrane protein